MEKRLILYNNQNHLNRDFKDEIRHSMAFVQKRFQFNLEQIEKRYCSTSSGLVFNLKNDKLDFDPDQCDAENEEELLNSVKKELHKHTLDIYGGSAILSTPAQDPEQKDVNNIDRWKKLNKLYKVFLSNSIKREPVKRELTHFPYQQSFFNQQSQKRGFNFAVPSKRKFAYESVHRKNDTQRQSNFASIMFPQMIKREGGSIAESHAIDEPIIQPLLPSFRTPRKYNVISYQEGPLTRSRAKMLAIEQDYDKRTDIIYAEETDWVGRWVNEASFNTEQSNLDFD